MQTNPAAETKRRRFALWRLWCALSLGTPALVGQPQTNFLWGLDLNGDGLDEVAGIETAWLQQAGPTSMDCHGQFLLAVGGAALLETPVALRPNDVLSLEPGPEAAWRPALGLSNDCAWPTSATNLPYVGVRMAAADGLHLGWIELGESWDLKAFGWQPKPEEPLRVGEQPPPLPVGHESVGFVAVDLDGEGLDFVLRVRRWTNAVSGSTGVSAVLTNRTGFEVLVRPGWAESGPLWVPVPVPEGGEIPSDPPAPASWQGPPANVVLLDEQRDAQGHLLASVGPLAEQRDVVVAVRSLAEPSRPSAWLLFDRGFRFLGGRFGRVPLGPPPLQYEESSRTELDLNADGRADFYWVYCAIRRLSNNGLDGWEWANWSLLFPAARSRILTTGLPANALISTGSGASGEWGATGVMLHSENRGVGGVERVFPGLLGLQFESAHGVHVAWMPAKDGYSVFEPRPGHPLRAGVVPRSLWGAVQGDELVLSWNYWYGLEAVLESTLALDPSRWQPLSAQTPGRAVLPLTTASRFFRLSQPEPTPGLLRACQEIAGYVQVLAFSEDADHLVFVDDAGPREWWADGRVEGPESLIPAGFEVWGAALSSDGAYALCTGRAGLPLGRPELAPDVHAIRIRLADARSQSLRCPELTCFSTRGWCALSADGRRALLASEDEVAVAEADESRFETVGSLAGRGPVALAPDGSLAIVRSRGAENVAEVHDVAEGRWIGAFTNQTAILSLALDSEGRMLAVGGRGGRLTVWRLDDGACAGAFEAGSDVYTMALSSDGHYLLASGDSGTMLWDVATGRLLWSYPGRATALAMSRDHRHVATGTSGTLLWWDVSELTSP